MHLDERKMGVVFEVVAAGGVRAAAERLNVDPSVVSRQIAQAEDEVGLTLFDRQGRRMVPTAAAFLLVEFMREHRIRRNDLRAKLDDLIGSRTGLVRIATGEGFATDLTTGPVRAFREAHPQVLVTIETMTVDAIMRALEVDEVDVGIAHNPPAGAGTCTWARRQLPIGFVATSSHPLMAVSHPLSVEEVSAQPLALLSTGFGLRKAVEVVEFLERVQFSAALETNSVAVLKAFAMSGAGGTLLPHSVVRHECERGELSIAPIDHEVFRSAEMHVLTRRDRVMPPPAGRIIAFLTRYAQTI